MTNCALSIIKQLEELAARFSEARHRDLKEQRVLHDTVMHFLDKVETPETIREVMASEEIHGVRKTLIAANAEFHLRTERQLAEDYLAHSENADPFERSWINIGFGALLKGQLGRWKAAGVFDSPHQRRIVVVGGGAMPQSQVFFHRECGLATVSVERDPTSAMLCRCVLDRLGLEKLQVVNCDGLEFEYQERDLVVIATLVAEKAEIAGKLRKTTRDAVCAPRVPVRLHQMWRTGVADATLTGWRLIDHFEPSGSSVAAQVYLQSIE